MYAQSIVKHFVLTEQEVIDERDHIFDQDQNEAGNLQNTSCQDVFTVDSHTFRRDSQNSVWEIDNEGESYELERQPYVDQ